MKIKSSRPLALALALLMLLPLLPTAARAVDEEEIAGVSAVEDIIVEPSRKDGHIRFDQSGDIKSLAFRDSDGNKETAAVSSITEAMHTACSRTFPSGITFEYISYVTVPGTQGALYDGYNNESDTGAGVAGVAKYYYREADGSSNRIDNIRFVPKPSFSGQAVIGYYGYYSYMTFDTEAQKNVVRRGSYSGRILVQVGKQEPGIAYSTDGEPAKFSSSDFITYSIATNGRSFSYLSFRLPAKSEGTLYYNYIDESIYDYAITAASRYYNGSTPTVDRIYFVPAKDYEGTVYIEFNGVDTANAPITGELVITVTNNGASHHQPRAEGPFAYTVHSGRPVNLQTSDFADETSKQLGGDGFLYFSFASLPAASTGKLYDDASSGAAHNVSAGVNYYDPSKIRFVAQSGYTGLVSVPIVVTGKSGESYDSMLRFAVLPGEDSPLRYQVEPERRVSFISTDFADACFSATGYDIARVHFDTLPPVSTGALYFGKDPVTARTSDMYYKEQLDQITFLASAGFTGETTVSFTGYAYGYSSSNGRAFHGTVTLVSTETVPTPSNIGGTSTLITVTASCMAVPLESYRIQAAAASSLPGAPATISFSRPAECGRLFFDFVSLSNSTELDATRFYPISDVSRVSFLPKADFSGSEDVHYTVRDASGNSFTGSIRFVVTPPVRSSFFSDMNQFTWAVPAVDFFRNYGATTGMTTSSFGPDSPMKRGDFILMLNRLFDFPYAGTASFDDVLEYKYYAEAIAAARALGVVTGSTIVIPAPTQPSDPNDPESPLVPIGQPQIRYVFEPEEPITREDAALYLYRAMLVKDSGSIEPGTAADLAQFPDAYTVSYYAVEAMGALVREGVFKGYVHNLLPKRTLNRAETITILYRALV